MEVNPNHPYLSLVILKALPREQLEKTSHGKHPYAAISIRIRTFEEKFREFIEFFINHIPDRKTNNSLCDIFKEACYSAAELLEAYSKSFYCCFSKTKHKKVCKNFDKFYKCKRKKIAHLVNKCKHEHQEIFPVIASSERKFIIGFLLTESQNFDTLNLDRNFHEGGNATSFRFFITEILDSIFSIDIYIYETLKKEFKVSKCIEEGIKESSSRTLEILKMVSSLNDLVFPSEFKKPVKSLEWSNSNYKLSLNRFKKKTFKRRYVVESTAIGDGFTKTFEIPNV